MKKKPHIVADNQLHTQISLH